MNIKEQLEKIKSLSEEVDTLKNKIDSHVVDVAYRFSVVYPDKHNRPSSKGNFGDWYIQGNMVICNWSDSWSYGGYDEGIISVPIDYIYDNDRFEEFILQCEITKKIQKSLSERHELQQKKLLFDQLKKELGNNHEH